VVSCLLYIVLDGSGGLVKNLLVKKKKNKKKLEKNAYLGSRCVCLTRLEFRSGGRVLRWWWWKSVSKKSFVQKKNQLI
jgi:hypothetical protein